MANVSVFNMEGKEVGTIELSDAVFGAKINEHLVHMAVVQHLANKRQGTQKAKTRSEVSGGGRKPWRQKGTGHARQGSIRAPQWKGGGVVFAPVPRDYSFKLNKKEKRAALTSALTSKVNDNKLIVVDELQFDEIKTKKFKAVMDNLNAGKALVVLSKDNITDDRYKTVVLSARNLPEVKTAMTNTINVYDVVNADKLVITKAAVEKIEEVYGNGGH
ncbi:MAG: 50S ribosomal protein L4 [Lachnospiraceae bacterium]|nr:50S ribosomal protein L4 [Lachnospiraceae bacterium]MBD5497154.1 50S ribosomal protein L4 [Lachnospiraceae bacterium]MBD5510244.1 50S ribosomal protein L4 [Lachnospiraceae bacterium]MBD5536198.1 50S ribosomal protein L4 [Lachnospiraceae bacterium]